MASDARNVFWNEKWRWLPTRHEFLSPLGYEIGDSPLKLCLLWLLWSVVGACLGITLAYRAGGYQLRTLGTNRTAARYAMARYR